MSKEMELLSVCVQMGLQGGKAMPVVLQGPPGVGKTDIVKALASSIEVLLGEPFPFESFAAPQRMPEEIGGLPVPDLERMETHCLPMRIGKNLISAKKGLLLIDEYSSASSAMGAACMTLIQNGYLGDHPLGNAVARVLCMNPESCATNGRDLTPPESNRLCWINWNLDFKDWSNYMLGGKGAVRKGRILPKSWEEDFGLRANSLVVSFLARHIALFDAEQTMPKGHDQANSPWPSPRSWENAARLLAACWSLGEAPSSDLAHLAVSGCVGLGAATTFLGWFVEMDIPDPEDLLKDKAYAKEVLTKLGETRPDKLQAALETLAAAAMGPGEQEEQASRCHEAWDIIVNQLETYPDSAIYALEMLVGLLKTGKNPYFKRTVDNGVIRDLCYKLGFV